MAEMEYNTGSVDPVEGYFKTICPTQANSNQLKYWCIMTDDHLDQHELP